MESSSLFDRSSPDIVRIEDHDGTRNECNVAPPTIPTEAPPEENGVKPSVTLRAEIEDFVRAGQAAGETIRGQFEGHAEATEKGFAHFIGLAVALHHALTPEERKELLRRRNVASVSARKSVSPYLSVVQALFSDDKAVRDKFKSKLSQWSKLAQGAVEKCDVNPTLAAVEAFLVGTHEGRSGRRAALDALKGGPKTVKAKGDGVGRKKGEPDPKPARDGLATVLSGCSDDDLAEVETGALLAFSDLLRRVLNARGS